MKFRSVLDHVFHGPLERTRFFARGMFDEVMLKQKSGHSSRRHYFVDVQSSKNAKPLPLVESLCKSDVGPKHWSQL